MPHASPPARSCRAWDAAALALALGICVLTLSPGEKTGGPAELGFDSPSLADGLRNLVLFAPLALAVALAGHRHLTSLVLCGALSAGIELAQLAIPGRTATLSDVACNTLGAAVALALRSTHRAWLRPLPRAAWLFRALALMGVWVAVLMGGWLFSTHTPAGQYFGGWTPEFGGMDRHPGRVLEARIGEFAIPEAGPALDSTPLWRGLLDAVPIRVRWQGEAPIASGRLAPVVILIGPASEELLLVATRGDDLVLRRWRMAARFLLEQPELVDPGALGGVDPRAVVDLRMVPDASGMRLALGGADMRHIGLGAGRGWALLAPDRWVDPTVRPALDALWLAILFFPIGLWLPRDWSGAALLVTALACLWVLPERVGLLGATAIEWSGAIVGVIAGYLAQRAAIRAAG